VGIGLVRFEFSIYNSYPGKGYLWDGDFTESNYSVNLMYGLTFPSPFGNWSFETGLTYQYYYFNKNWNKENTGSEDEPTLYRLTDGEPHEGSVIGLFLQAGGFWFQINTLKYWAVGISLPIPWW
jgi:hypothetical protein